LFFFPRLLGDLEGGLPGGAGVGLGGGAGLALKAGLAAVRGRVTFVGALGIATTTAGVVGVVRFTVGAPVMAGVPEAALVRGSEDTLGGAVVATGAAVPVAPKV
jgi:hypothetical protein